MSQNENVTQGPITVLRTKEVQSIKKIAREALVGDRISIVALRKKMDREALLGDARFALLMDKIVEEALSSGNEILVRTIEGRLVESLGKINATVAYIEIGRWQKKMSNPSFNFAMAIELLEKNIEEAKKRKAHRFPRSVKTSVLPTNNVYESTA